VSSLGVCLEGAIMGVDETSSAWPSDALRFLRDDSPDFPIVVDGSTVFYQMAKRWEVSR